MRDTSHAPDRRQAAWLLSRFPAHNHAFMLRELERMEQLGFEVLPVAVGEPDRPPGELSERERRAHSKTWYAGRTGLAAVAAAQARVLARRPIGWLRGLWTALTFSRWDVTRLAANLKYFLGAVLIGDRLEQSGIRRIHSHYTSTIAYLIGRVFGPEIRYTMTIHGSGEFEDVRGFRLAEKVRDAEAVIAISAYGRSQMCRITSPELWPKIHVVHLGVPDAGDVAGRPRGVPFVLASAGALVPVKGYPLLLDAVAELRQQGREVRLILAGDGEQREVLTNLARRLGLIPVGVEFAGWVPGDRLKEIYGRADSFVMSSFAEGIPVVLMEAMSMGIPCVAPGIMGIPELIEDGVSGLLTPPGDAPAIAAAVRRLMDDPELAVRLGQAARQTVASRFDLEQNTEALATLLDGCWGLRR